MGYVWRDMTCEEKDEWRWKTSAWGCTCYAEEDKPEHWFGGCRLERDRSFDKARTAGYAAFVDYAEARASSGTPWERGESRRMLAEMMEDVGKKWREEKKDPRWHQ